MKKLFSFFTVALFLCISINSYAQVANYTFTQSAGTYVPITGGTIVATATSASGAGSLDDNVYNLPSGTIPFTFTYDGVGYTGLDISTNGFITFGLAPGGTNYTPISNAALYPGAVSALGGDLNSLFNILGNTGEIRYETVGSEFVIQYSNFRPFSTSTSTTVFWRWNFQIRLHSDGSIRTVYDANFVGAPTSTTRQVGLRGPNNTFATNVKNRLVTTGTHTWATSVNGTANTSTCPVITTNIPVSGQTYTFTPPPPPVAIDVAATGITSSQGTLYLCPPYLPTDFTVTVKNIGTTTQNIVPVYYRVNGGSAVGPVNTVGPIIQNGTENVVFNGANAFTPPAPGTYVIKAYTQLAGDVIYANDTTTLTITVNPIISTFPYIETWNNLAAGWTLTVENPIGTTQLYGLVTGLTGPRGIANDTSMRANFFNGSALRREILKSPLMDISSLANPVLDFYVAYKTYTGGEEDTLQVVLSTDCGVTFFNASTVYDKSPSSNPSLATRPPAAGSFVPDSAIQWRHETISLANVAGLNNVIIGFRAKSDFGNMCYIDNIIVTDVSGLCTDNVTGPGSYNCNTLVTLGFTATPAPPPLNRSIISDNGINKSLDEMQTLGSIPVSTEKVRVINNGQFDNPLGGHAFVSQYTALDPGQTIAPNVGFTNSTPPTGPAYDPTFVYHDYWFTVTYDGNDFTGYATYNIKIDLDGLVFTDPTKLYVVKRVDKTGAWVCQNTTISGNALVVTGLTNFSDFALAGDEALPVELSSFTSAISGRDVTLNWSTVSENNNSGFDVERSSANGTWSKVGNVSGNGTVSTPVSYSFTDRNLATGNYNYRLKQIDFNGNFEYFNLSNEVIIGIPSKFELSQNYPNPFNPSTKITFALPNDGKVSLKIYDMTGKEVMLLVNEVKTAGYYSVSFNASSLSSGIYFYTLSADNFTATKKMMLVK